MELQRVSTLVRCIDAGRRKSQFSRLACGGLIATLAVLELACGGGSSNKVIEGGPSPLNASFAPAAFTPGPNLVRMAQKSASHDQVTISVEISDTNGLYGVGFNVAYDPNRVAFVGWYSGGLLEQGGNQVGVIVSDKPSLGVVVVNLTRMGNEPTVNVGTAATLVNLTFRVVTQGTSELSFESGATLYDGQIPPQPIPSSTWYGGSIQGS